MRNLSDYVKMRKQFNRQKDGQTQLILYAEFLPTDSVKVFPNERDKIQFFPRILEF